MGILGSLNSSGARPLCPIGEVAYAYIDCQSLFYCLLDRCLLSSREVVVDVNVRMIVEVY